MGADTDLIITALKSLPPKPTDAGKQAYSQRMSTAIANALSEALRGRGLSSTRPAPPGSLDSSGAERRMAGGIGDKKVDVTWATEEGGLLLALSIKTINFRDSVTGNYQKNFTNRRGDMLFEAVTLHRRFPYAVLGGLFFFDHGAANDDTTGRRSTFINAHAGLRLFTGRDDPAGRDEQFERFYVGLVDATPFNASVQFTVAGEPDRTVVLDELVDLVAARNPDAYEARDGQLTKRR